uniref:CSON010611 protein n=1 Tax=Culicoides sonorensis TaxID=179676 RepID=A0A336M226_CULSO
MEVKRIKLDLFPFEKLPLELQLMIFSYCTPKERRDNLSFVSKSWAENLQSFTEDYQLDLYDCYLKEEIDPFSVLFNSTRQYRFLKLGKEITSENVDLYSRLLSHLGKHVHVLEFASSKVISILKESNFLLMFPVLKKLIVTRMFHLTKFNFFPESLEHIHVNQLSVMEQTKEVDHLKKIKNLHLWTSELINFRVGKEALSESSSTIFSLNEKLKEILESLQTLDNIYLKVSTNFIGTPVVQIDDVIGMEFQRKPKTFLSFSDLPNLKSIIFMYGSLGHPKSACFDNHKVNICAKVEELKISWDYKKCTECFTTFIDSVPNLKKLTFLCCECENEQFKYICSKLPQLKHLEVDSYISRTNFKVFCEKLPNIEFFKIDKKSNVDDDSFIEILTQSWKHLRTFIITFGLFDRKEFTNIKDNCKKLRTLELSYRAFTPSLQYNLFQNMPCLRKIEDDFYRRDFYNIVDYLKHYRIPYNSIGSLKNIVEEYKIEPLDENDDDIDDIIDDSDYSVDEMTSYFNYKRSKK